MKSIFISRTLTVGFAILYCGFSNAAPKIITSATKTTSTDQQIVISGEQFGEFDGQIVSWDDFETHTTGQKISGLTPISGHKWSTIYDYKGNGIVIDSQFSISGSNSIKVDWTVDPESIRAFGWSGKGPYKQLYISYWRLMTGDFVAATSNHKQFYLYGNKSGFPQGMPLIPGGQKAWGFYNNVSSGYITAANPNPNNINSLGWEWDNTKNSMQRWEFFIKLNEPYTEKNGIIQVWLDGKKGIDNKQYQISHVDGEFVDFRLGHMAQGFFNTAKAWFDDIYIATTQARVEICDSPVYEKCSIKHLQYIDPSQWEDTQITLKLRNLRPSIDNKYYLFVIDRDGQPSNSLQLARPNAPYVN